MPFERWNRIYSTSDDVNKVQRNIRIGHKKTVDNVLAWLQEQGNLTERSFCDAGCGVGNLAIPLTQPRAAAVLGLRPGEPRGSLRHGDLPECVYPLFTPGQLRAVNAAGQPAP